MNNIGIVAKLKRDIQELEYYQRSNQLVYCMIWALANMMEKDE